MARDRSRHHRRAHRRHRGRRKPSRHDLRRRGHRRRVEDGERRNDVGADLRRLRHDVDRRHRRLALQPEHRLGRHRRGEQPAELVVGQRHLQVDRRWRLVDLHGARRHEAHRPHRHSPDQPRHRLRRGGRPPVRPEQGARAVQDDRRREDVDEHEVHRREHGLHRRRHGSARSEHALRGGLPAAAQGVRLQRRRTGQRRCTRRPTPRERGRASRAVCRPATSAASASTSTGRTRTSSTWRTSTRTAGFSGPTIAERRGTG